MYSSLLNRSTGPNKRTGLNFWCKLFNVQGPNKRTGSILLKNLSGIKNTSNGKMYFYLVNLIKLWKNFQVFGIRYMQNSKEIPLSIFEMVQINKRTVPE